MNDMLPRRAIGIDIGGTKIAGVLIEEPHTTMLEGHLQCDNPPHILAQAQCAAHAGNDALLDDVMTVINTLHHEHNDMSICTIGIGTPGSVDTTTGDVRDIANLNIHHIALGKQVSERTHVPVTVENDVNAAAIGAIYVLPDLLGQADTVAFLNLGTGLAAGVIRNGHIYRGSSNTAGEIGHVPVEPHRWLCSCGQVGCLETAGSGGAAARLWPYNNPPMPAILHAAHDLHHPRHKEAVETADTIIHAIADAIDILATTVDPNVIIIGGGMSKTGLPLLTAIQQELFSRSAPSPFVQSLLLPERLQLAPHNVPIGAIGAAINALDSLPCVSSDPHETSTLVMVDMPRRSAHIIATK